MRIRKVKWYTSELVRNNPDCLFIYGNNLLNYGKGGQAIIRDEPNAYGIPTKKEPSLAHKAFFNDNEYEQNVSIIDNAINNMPSTYKVVVFPEDGLGTGLADLPSKAPKTYAYLVNTINQKFGDIYE